MGNVLDVVKSKTDNSDEEDLEYMCTQNSALFNDGFLGEIYESLPEFEGTSIPEVGEGKSAVNALDIKVKRLVQIFSAQEKKITRVEDFPTLSSNEELENSVFSVNNKMRSRLLQRIHLAYLRQVQDAHSSVSGDDLGVSSSSSGSNSSNVLVVSGNSSKGGAQTQHENGDAILSATSIRMSLAILQCLGPTNPTLFPAISGSILDLLANCSSLALCSLEEGSPQAAALQSITTFAKETALNVKSHRRDALSLMLAVAVTSGSLQGLLAVVNLLLEGQEGEGGQGDGGVCLPDTARVFLSRLAEKTTPLLLSLPSPDTVKGDFLAKVNIDIEKSDMDRYESECCTDGSYLFVWNGLDTSLRKIGTGFHGTIAGNEYVFNSTVLQQLRERLGPNVFEAVALKTAEEGVESSADYPSSSAPTEQTSSSPRPGRLVISNEHAVIFNIETYLEDGDDVESALVEEYNVPEATSCLSCEEGSEYPILEELTMDLGYETVLFYRVDEYDWIPSVLSVHIEAGDNDNSDSDDSCENDGDSYSTIQSMVEVVEVFDSGSGGAGVEGAAGGSGRGRGGQGDSGSSSGSSSSSPWHQGWLACVQGKKLYLRLEAVLGPFRVALFSCSALKLEDILDISLPIPDYIKAKQVWQEGKYLEMLESSKAAALSEEAAGENTTNTNTNANATLLADSLKRLEKELALRSSEQGNGANGDSDGDGDSSALDQFQYSTEAVDLLTDATTPIPSLARVISASSTSPTSIDGSDISSDSNRSSVEMNLLVSDALWSGQTPFVFAGDDNNQELLLDLGELLRVTTIGALYSSEGVHAVEESFTVHVSHDGEEYVQFGVAEPDSDSDSASVTLLHRPLDEDSNSHDPAVPTKDIRYIRFNFGRHTSSGMGSAVSRLVVRGLKKTKKKRKAPFLAMTSDGYNLLFIQHKETLDYSSSNSGSNDQVRKEHSLKSFLIDPSCGMSVVREREYAWAGVETEAQLHKCSFIFNSALLVVSHPKDFAKRMKNKKEVSFSFHKLDSYTGKRTSSSDAMFSSNKGLPSSVTYDSRNNMIWAWDAETLRFIRWRNVGLPPSFIGTPPGAAAGGAAAAGGGGASGSSGGGQTMLLLSPHPQHRITALRTLREKEEKVTDPRLEAALILSQLDRLSLPFSPPDMPRAESKALNEIEVCSGGYDDGNYGRILIRGQHCCLCSRGFNILTLDGQLQPKDFRNFDTHGASESSERLADFVDTVAEGTIVLAAVMDSAHQHLTSRGKAALSQIGAKCIDKLGHRGSFALIGKKGGEADDLKQKVASRRSGDAVVRQRIPTLKAPLCYECKPDTIHTLVTLIDRFHGSFRRGDGSSELDKVILMSAMRLLMTNIFQLLEGLPVSDALLVFSAEDRRVTVRVVNDLIEHPSDCEGGYLISEVALRLFVNSIDVLYPSPSQKCALLVGYLDAFANDTISELGRSVLELLLRQMSVPSSLVKLFCGADSLRERAVTPTDLIHSLMSIAKKDTLQRLASVVDVSNATATSALGGTGVGAGAGAGAGASAVSVGEASVQMLSIVCNMVLSQSTQVVVACVPPAAASAAGGGGGGGAGRGGGSSESTEEGGEESPEAEVSLSPERIEQLQRAALASQVQLEGACRVLLSLLTTFTDASAAILQAGKTMNDSLVAVTQKDSVATLDDEIDIIIRNSPVGVLLPTILNTTALLFESHGQKMIDHLTPPALTANLSACLSAMKAVLGCIPQHKLQPPGAAGDNAGTRSSVHVFESEHPYASNTDESTELNFPNAIRMTFTFDEQTRTEHNYDWLRIWKDQSKAESLLPASVDKLSGRNGSENWPGFGGRPPLVIEGCQAYLEWHSDSSNEDWGWRVSVQVEYKRKAEARIHWLMELENQMVYCGSAIAASMIISTQWETDKEDRNACWMENSLLKSGFRDQESHTAGGEETGKEEGGEAPLSEEDAAEMTFLHDFVERPPGSLASHLCRIMKTKVIEDMGQVDEVNRAVYATCAALMRHKNVVSEAMAVANGTREPSESLLKVWKTGQKMRTFFDFGDLKNASPDVMLENCDDLPPPPAMERGPSIYSGAETFVIKAAADRVITRATFLLRVNSAVKTAELAHESANRKWKLVSKMAFSHQQQAKEQAEGWETLVGELHSAYRLKGMLEYRRSALKRVKNTHLTTSEKVLRFVQGFAVVADLEHVRAIRNTRTCIRAQGFDMMSTLMEAAATPFSVKWLMLSFSRAMRATGRANRPHRHVHYLNTIEGCSQKERSIIIRSFCGFVEKCVYTMNKSYAKSRDDQRTAPVREKWKQVTISCLRALAIDYDMLDHPILDKSNVLAAVQFFLQVSDDPDIYGTALSLFELLLPRCVGLEGQMSSINSHHEPSELSKKLVALLVSELDRASQKVTTRSQPLVENSLATSLGSVNLLSKTVGLRRDCMGYTAPHIAMGLQHSITFWFKRHRCAIDTLFEATEPLTASQLVGCSVLQGPDWNPLKLDNGHEDNIGTVLSFDEDTKLMKVKWTNNKNTGTYKFGKEDASSGSGSGSGAGQFEVVLADAGISGHVYSKGMRAVLSEEDRPFVWSTFGLQLTADARLMMFATKDEDGNYRAKSEHQVPPDVWTHVSVIQDVKTTRLYLNGELDCEQLIVPSMLYPIKGVKEKEIVESPHPYLDNTTCYTEVAVEGAISYTITFDPRTRTEQSYDFIRFYKDANHSDYWGSDKYSGGRSGSRANWPGFNDHPPLIIPAAKFVVYFKSDGSNNDWGYRITCIAEKKIVYEDEKPHIQVLNTMPFYIGQTPTYVDNLPSIPSATGFISDLNVFGKKALTKEEITQVMAVSPVTAENGIDDEVSCLNILGIMTKSQMSVTGFTSSLLNNAFVGPNILYPLFNILANGTGHAQISSVRVCASLLCVYPVEMIDVQAKRVGLVYNDSFLGYLFNRVGAVKNAYYSRNFETSQASVKARFCNELSFAIGLEYLTLLNALVTSELWVDVISATIEDVLVSTAPRVLQEISRQISQETTLGFSSNYIGVDSSDLNMVLVVLGLCGGGLTGLYMGSSARCTVGDDNGIIEDCTILNAAWPPSQEELDAMAKDKGVSKSDVDMWKDKTCFTDAFYVVLKSQPTKPLLVPRDKVNIEKCSVAPALSSLISKYASNFIGLFEALSAINCADMRPKHLPRIVASDEVQEFESEHPYLNDTHKSTVIEFPGATAITIAFDRRSRTESTTAIVTFFKDDSKTEYWGQAQYGGRDAAQNWPGLGGCPALVIPAEQCVLHFETNGDSAAATDWGYKVTASAHCVVKTHPPERPPLLHNAIAGHIKLLGMTALHAILKEFSWFSLHCMPILGHLVASALAPLPASKLDMARVKPVTLESKHPYENNMDEYYTVRVSGAKKLKIIFDEQTCTENGADYVRFYKDDSHSECWGDSAYTGGKDGGSSNWPGMQGREPLIIPANTFVVYFKTDGSVTAWGYKIFITSLDDDADAVPNMDSTLCSFRAHCNHMVIRDCRLSQAEPEGLELFETEAVATAGAGAGAGAKNTSSSGVGCSGSPAGIAEGKLTVVTSDLTDSSSNSAPGVATPMDKVQSSLGVLKSMASGARPAHAHPWQGQWPRRFCANTTDARSITLYSQPAEASDVVVEADLRCLFIADQEQGDWLHVTTACPITSSSSSAAAGNRGDANAPPPPPPAATTENSSDGLVQSLDTLDSTQDEAPVPNTTSASEIPAAKLDMTGWILRRQGDMIFVIPQNSNDSSSSSSSSVHADWINLDEVLSPSDSSGNTSAVDRHPMYDVDESTLADVYGTNHMQPTPVEVLQSETKSPERSAVEMCQLGSIALSQDCISEILSLWPKDIPFSLDCFGSVDGLMQYVRAAYMRDISNGKAIGSKGSRLDALKDHILQAIRLDEGSSGASAGATSPVQHQDQDQKSAGAGAGAAGTGVGVVSLCDNLMNFAITQLSASLHNEKALPPTMGKLFVVESNHPYDDNMNEFWDVHIPGASSLKLVFDARTSTEKDCDYVSIHNDRNQSVNYGQRFTGRKRSNDKVWAGLGSVQPLVIPGDKCVVRFYSDSSNTDWGFKLYCYGVMSEPTEEQREEQKEQRVSPDRPFADLACWLLEFLAKEPFAGVYRNLYAASTIATLRRYVEIMPARKKCFAIHLLTNMLQEVPRIPLGEDVHEEICILKDVIGALASTQYTAENAGNGGSSRGNGGGGGANTSQLLQALIQAAIVLDNCLTFLSSTDKEDTLLKNKANVEAITVAETAAVVTSDDSMFFLEQVGESPTLLPSSPLCWSLSQLSSGLLITDEGTRLACTAPAEAGVVATSLPLHTAVSVQGYCKRGVRKCFVEVMSMAAADVAAGEAVGSPALQIGLTVLPEAEEEGSAHPSCPFRVSLDSAGTLTVTSPSSSESDAVTGVTVTRHKHFGPALVPGDVVALELDLDAHVVTFRCNQALVGVAVGPSGEGSGAACEVTWGRVGQDRPLHVWVGLGQQGDSVRLVSALPPPLAPVTTMTSLVKASEWPVWFDPIREAVTLLKSCYSRELPTAVLLRDFLPACEEQWSVVLQSSHPFDGQRMVERAHIPHAESLTVRFHSSTHMGTGDVIIVQGQGEGQAGGENTALRHEYIDMTSGTDQGEAAPNSISVGDQVVRGAGWDWGNQDGGAGSIGEVVDLTTWKGKNNAGVTVKWSRNGDFTGLYRWDWEGVFDLLVVGHSDKSRRPLVVPGSALRLEVIPAASSVQERATATDAVWKGALYFNGQTSFLQPPQFGDTFDMSADLTVETWVKVATNIPRSEQCLPMFSRQIEVDGKITQFALQLCGASGGGESEGGGGQGFQLVMEAANTQMQTSFRLSGGVVTPGVWTHVCGVVSGSMTAILVNGVLVSTSNSFTGTRLGALGAPLLIGKSADNKYFKGNMFDLRVWSLGRPIAEVKEAKDSPLSQSETQAHPQLVCALGCREEDIIMGGSEGMLNDSTVQGNGPTVLCDVLWDSAVEPNILPVDTHFGFMCTVTPTFSLKTLLSESAFAHRLMKLQCQYTVGELRHDLALVRYINIISRTRKMKIDQLLRCEWADIAPTAEELAAMPLLKELLNMGTDATIEHLLAKNAATAGQDNGTSTCTSNGDKSVQVGSNKNNHADDDDDGGGCEETKGPTREEQATDIGVEMKISPTSSTPAETEGSQDKKKEQEKEEEEEESFVRPITARFTVLKLLNKALADTIQFIDLCMLDKGWSVAHLLTLCRGLVFEVTKTPIWETALAATASSSSSKFDLRLSRSRAAKHKRTGRCDTDARWMVFCQAFRQMHTLPPSTLRRADQLFYTTFAGERAHDAGGPYREAFAMMYLELQSSSLPLLCKTPNGRHSVGQNREKWILNPSATSSLHLDMFSFLGKLMGIAIRSKEYMELNISSIIWKLLVQEVPSRDDLEAIDLFQIQSLDNMRNIHLQGITRESFSVTFYETFTTMSTDDRMVELVTGGEEKHVDFDNREQYCDLIEQYRLHEFDQQAAAIRRGLASLIPHRLLSLYTWDQLEVMVCGRDTIDIALLKSVTEYSSCSSTDTHIQYFWQIMEDFSEEERSTFLRFVWGRSRLPLTADGFSQRFKLQLFGKQPADQYLPVAHTCFFSLEFPSYSSLEVAKEKLRYAIFNCQAIDGDDTSVGMQAAALGWEE